MFLLVELVPFYLPIWLQTISKTREAGPQAVSFLRSLPMVTCGRLKQSPTKKCQMSFYNVDGCFSTYNCHDIEFESTYLPDHLLIVRHSFIHSWFWLGSWSSKHIHLTLLLINNQYRRDNQWSIYFVRCIKIWKTFLKMRKKMFVHGKMTWQD